MNEPLQEMPPARVLVVDNEKSMRTAVRALLIEAGYAAETAEDAKTAEAKLSSGTYDVVVSDIVLSSVSGIALLQRIRATAPDVQVIMMTGEPTVDTAAEAVRAGASDYLAKPVTKKVLLHAVTNALRVKRLDDERRRLADENRAYQVDLERRVHERTRELEEALGSWRASTEGTIQAMSAAIESRDPYTAGHQQRVADLSRAIARELGMTEEDVCAVYYVGIVHDLGKISVPAEILSNPGRLCEEAMSLVRKHARTGSRILEKIHFPWPIARITLEHHERLDGSGYPQGLSGEQISRGGRILAVADVVEAMASHRPYRPALGIAAALEEIEKGQGVKYDAEVVHACLALFRERRFEFAPPAR